MIRSDLGKLRLADRNSEVVWRMYSTSTTKYVHYRLQKHMDAHVWMCRYYSSPSNKLLDSIGEGRGRADKEPRHTKGECPRRLRLRDWETDTSQLFSVSMDFFSFLIQ